MKQTCEKRRCLHPQLPICAFCSVCELDGYVHGARIKQWQNAARSETQIHSLCSWNNVPLAGRKEAERPEDPPNLFECTVCLDIVHPGCAEKTVGLGKINSDLSKYVEQMLLLVLARVV